MTAWVQQPGRGGDGASAVRVRVRHDAPPHAAEAGGAPPSSKLQPPSIGPMKEPSARRPSTAPVYMATSFSGAIRRIVDIAATRSIPSPSPAIPRSTAIVTPNATPGSSGHSTAIISEPVHERNVPTSRTTLLLEARTSAGAESVISSVHATWVASMIPIHVCDKPFSSIA